MADVAIATKTCNDEVAYIYEIDNEGNIKGKKPSHLGTGLSESFNNDNSSTFIACSEFIYFN